MADFKDVVKSLKDNKTAQDDGFNRLEAAVKGTDPKSIQEETAKKEASTKNKELNYFADIGEELKTANKNLVDGFKSLVTPSGALGGIMALIAAPIFFIKGFLTGLLDSFKALGKLFPSNRIVKNFKVFFNRTLPRFFSGIFGKSGSLGKTLASFKSSTIGKPIVDFITRIKTAFQTFTKTPLIKNIKAGFKFVMQPFKMIGDVIKMFTSGSGGIGAALKPFTATFKAITKFAGTIGKVLGRLFLPLTFIMTAFDTIMGAIDGFKGTDGNIVQKILGGLGGAIKGFMKLVTVPLDLVKSLISWIAGKFGFTEFEKLLDGFSFTELFGKAVDWLYVDLPAFFTNLFSWNNIKAMLSGALDFANEIGKSLQRVIHGALNWVKSLFGFGDKGDFAPPEMPVTKDVRAFLTFEWLNDLLKPVTDFFKSIMDFDFMGFIKKIPGVGALLDYISGDESNTVQDDGMKEQQERTKRMKELKKGLKEGSFDGIFTDSKDEAAELKKLEQEEKDYFANVRAGSADKGKLKTANLAGVKPSDGSDFKDVDPSEMTEEQLKAAMIDYNKEKNKLKGGRRFQFDRNNKDLRRALSKRRRDFRDQSEEENTAGGKINQAQLDKVGKSAGTTTIIDNSVSAPSNTNNNSSTSTFSPLVQTDNVVAAAVGADF